MLMYHFKNTLLRFHLKIFKKFYFHIFIEKFTASSDLVTEPYNLKENNQRKKVKKNKSRVRNSRK